MLFTPQADPRAEGLVPIQLPIPLIQDVGNILQRLHESLDLSGLVRESCHSMTALQYNLNSGSTERALSGVL